MSTEQLERDADPADVPAGRPDGEPTPRAASAQVTTRVRLLRRALALGWAAALAAWTVRFGIPFSRLAVVVWPLSALAIWSIGRRRLWQLLRDFLPLVAVLVVWDLVRGAADSFGMSTWWHPQLDADRWLFAGTVPSLWLQEHLKYATPRWWDVPVALTYLSFFPLAVTTAAVLWVRSHRDFTRWVARYVALSFAGFAVFALAPTAPPWAAARCLPQQVSDHPSDPACMSSHRFLSTGGMIGLADRPRPGAAPYVERISVDGLALLHLDTARVWVGFGQNVVADRVAAVPSLHAGAAMLFTVFMWSRVRRRYRWLLALYPLTMGFTLVYAGDHYVTDVLVGFFAAAVVSVIAGWVERRRATRTQQVAAEAA